MNFTYPSVGSCGFLRIASPSTPAGQRAQLCFLRPPSPAGHEHHTAACKARGKTSGACLGIMEASSTWVLYIYICAYMKTRCFFYLVPLRTVTLDALHYVALSTVVPLALGHVEEPIDETPCREYVALISGAVLELHWRTPSSRTRQPRSRCKMESSSVRTAIHTVDVLLSTECESCLGQHPSCRMLGVMS